MRRILYGYGEYGIPEGTSSTQEGADTLRATGFVRRIDALGRIVLPVGLRTSLGINEKGSVSIRREGNLLILEAHSGECIFCGGDGNVAEFKGRFVCAECTADITQRATTTL